VYFRLSITFKGLIYSQGMVVKLMVLQREKKKEKTRKLKQLKEKLLQIQKQSFITNSLLSQLFLTNFPRSSKENLKPTFS
jgi:P2-related tail formation protein